VTLCKTLCRWKCPKNRGTKTALKVAGKQRQPQALRRNAPGRDIERFLFSRFFNNRRRRVPELLSPGSVPTRSWSGTGEGSGDCLQQTLQREAFSTKTPWEKERHPRSSPRRPRLEPLSETFPSPLMVALPGKRHEYPSLHLGDRFGVHSSVVQEHDGSWIRTTRSLIEKKRSGEIGG
jgi:hypothetical protein